MFNSLQAGASGRSLAKTGFLRLKSHLQKIIAKIHG
jgi:hypothetical protein